ncbi:MAG: LrgB family protein [Candidatus Hydrogenedentota bacterium]
MRSLLEEPVFGIVLTLAAWQAANVLRQRTGSALANPVLLAAVGIVLLLMAADIPYAAYNAGGQYISFLLGPAVVALAVPLYRYRRVLRRHGAALAGSVIAGGLVGIISAAGMAVVLGATGETARSMAPKSVTTPIAIGIAGETGGLPSLTAAIVILTGMLGAVFGPPLLNALGVRSAFARGLALGTASHGIGTARAFEESEQTGALSSVAMVLNGLLTAAAVPWILPWFV